MKQKFDVTGMSCAACSARVEKAVSKLEGIEALNVNLLTNSMTVSYDDSELDDEKIIETVVRAGYGASVSTGASSGRKRGEGEGDALFEEAQSMKKRLITSIILFLPLFYISMGHMAGLPLPEVITTGGSGLILPLTELVLTAAIMVINRKYFISGFKAVINRAPNMDTLVALGASASVIYSLVITVFMIKGVVSGDPSSSAVGHELYFESAGTILTLITVGKYLEARSKGKTTDAISKLLDLSPETAVIVRDGDEIEVPAWQLEPGDTIAVKAGLRIPADGRIIEGVSAVDRSMLTGESMPVNVSPGDSVECGTVNVSGYIRVSVEKVGEDTALANIIRLVDEAGGSKAPIARLADRVSGVFVPAVIGIAIITGVIWKLTGAGIGFALSMAISVLVISCPCALGLATPVAVMVGTGKAAENGIIFKSGEYLEKAHEIDTIFFDKTGTLTEGVPEVVTGAVMPGISRNELYSIASSVERYSAHPLSDAIVRLAEKQCAKTVPVSDFETLPGKGVSATADGRPVMVGNVRMMEDAGVDISDASSFLKDLDRRAVTPVLVARDGSLIGGFGIADDLRETSCETVKRLGEMGIATKMLTGDAEKTAQAIGSTLGVSEVFARVLPEDKEKHIEASLSSGHVVAMVGDGINDAPALARADVGIAIGTGTDVAIESADIVLMKDDPLGIVTAIKLSRAVIRNIKMNLFWAFFYNIICIPLAAGALYPLFGIRLNPMIAALCMSLSSFCVVTNALRLRKFEPEKFVQPECAENSTES